MLSEEYSAAPSAGVPSEDMVGGGPNLKGVKAMELPPGLVIGIGALVFGFALVWFGMPNKTGENPRFLRNDFMQMIYPAIVLALMAAGIAQLLLSSW
jgi:hypothetical protein